MIIRTLLVAALMLAPLSAVEEGFVSLFNGKDLRGWVLVHKTRNGKGYLVEDGKIVCPKDGGGNLLTMKEYANFVIRLEFRMEPGGNSGLGIRAPLDGDISRTGIELQILDHGHERYKGIKPWQRHGSIYGIIPALGEALKPAGEWNEQEVTANGRKIKIILNGTTIVDGDLDTVTDQKVIEDHPGMLRTKGRIGFLGHGTLVEFRNIRIKELPDTP